MVEVRLDNGAYYKVREGKRREDCESKVAAAATATSVANSLGPKNNLKARKSARKPDLKLLKFIFYLYTLHPLNFDKWGILAFVKCM